MIAEQEKPKIDWLEKLTDFAIANGKNGCFLDWHRDTVKNYLAFHVHQKTIVFVMDKNEPVAMGMGNQCNADEVSSYFNWEPTNPKGDTLVLLDVISTKSGAILLLFVEMFKKWPAGSVDVVGFRKGKKVSITSKYIKLAASLC